MARRGIRKFLLIGRNPLKLKNTKSELGAFFDLWILYKFFIENEFSECEIDTLLFDFFDGDFKELRNALSCLDIGLAINSVGVGRNLIEKFGDTPEADFQLLRVNGLGAAEVLLFKN